MDDAKKSAIKGVEMMVEGILTDIKCGCEECDEFIVYAYYRIKRGLPPPTYIWGHYGTVNLRKHRFKKGNIPWDLGVKRPEETCEKISKSKKGKVHAGMFEKGHKRNVGKKYKKHTKET